MEKIIIFLQNRDFFGAQVVHIPLIQELKRKYPNSRITIFSKHKISLILKQCNLVNEVILETSKINTLVTYLRINPTITINLRKRSSFINIFISLLNFNKKIGFSTPFTKLFFTSVKKHNPKIYRAKNYLNLIESPLVPPILKISKRISIIPGAGGDFKIWNLKKYLTLAKALKEKYPQYEIGFVIGEKERGFKEAIQENKLFKLYFNLEINQLFDIIQTSQLIIANDCGPSHIAQISNTHYIILYSDEQNSAIETQNEWYNYKEGSSVLTSAPQKHINTLSVQDVFKEAETILDKYHSIP